MKTLEAHKDPHKEVSEQRPSGCVIVVAAHGPGSTSQFPYRVCARGDVCEHVSQFFPRTFMCLLGIELRPPGLYGKPLYLLSYLVYLLLPEAHYVI